jgi:hypothetical protein
MRTFATVSSGSRDETVRAVGVTSVGVGRWLTLSRDITVIVAVRNAIEALRDAPAGRIALSASRDADGRVAIMVADNGSGIAPPGSATAAAIVSAWTSNPINRTFFMAGSHLYAALHRGSFPIQSVTRALQIGSRSFHDD